MIEVGSEGNGVSKHMGEGGIGKETNARNDLFYDSGKISQPPSSTLRLSLFSAWYHDLNSKQVNAMMIYSATLCYNSLMSLKVSVTRTP